MAEPRSNDEHHHMDRTEQDKAGLLVDIPLNEPPSPPIEPSHTVPDTDSDWIIVRSEDECEDSGGRSPRYKVPRAVENIFQTAQLMRENVQERYANVKRSSDDSAVGRGYQLASEYVQERYPNVQSSMNDSAVGRGYQLASEYVRERYANIQSSINDSAVGGGYQVASEYVPRYVRAVVTSVRVDTVGTIDRVIEAAKEAFKSLRGRYDLLYETRNKKRLPAGRPRRLTGSSIHSSAIMEEVKENHWSVGNEGTVEASVRAAVNIVEGQEHGWVEVSDERTEDWVLQDTT